MGRQWQQTLALLTGMWGVQLEPNISIMFFNVFRILPFSPAGVSVARRDVGGELEPDVISYSAGISACEKGEQWQRALALLSDMRETKLEPDVSATTLGSARARRASSGIGRWRC
ncbi:unnamed protein product [Prorocentrum cordatum]|uniref:Pentatricopeptide repeat-containing protein n=1 Tax=Prorocentrum cordatum TaxID=2364126 RepID=A0ABN9S4R5_9DINO|nr:unnamed protein product [Polarella glacialis]